MMEKNNRIAIQTRPPDRKDTTNQILRELGLQPVSIPLIYPTRIDGVEDELNKINPEEFDMVLFSSIRAAEILQQTLPRHQFEKWQAKPCRTVGEKTGQELLHLGFKNILWGTGSIRSLLSNKKLTETRPSKWFHPCSVKTKADVKGFAERKIELINFPVYSPDLREIPSLFFPKLEQAFAIFFYSGSAVENLFKLAGSRAVIALQRESLKVVCVGASSLLEMKKHGINRIIAMSGNNKQQLQKILE